MFIKLNTSEFRVVHKPGQRIKTASIPQELIRPGYLYVRTRAISARTNRNYDTWPSEELKKSAHTFLGKPVFVNHENHDPSRSRGKIVAAEYKESKDDKFIELVIEVDAKNFPKLAESIINGDLDSVSMGANVAEGICSVCGNVAKTAYDFCNHIANQKGSKVYNDQGEKVVVSEICRKISFFEISFVFDPADETAVHQEVFMSKAASADSVTSPPEVDTLREDKECPECGELYSDEECACCGYVEQLDELSDPDTSKALEEDLEFEQDVDDALDENSDEYDEDDELEKEARQAFAEYINKTPQVVAVYYLKRN